MNTRSGRTGLRLLLLLAALLGLAVPPAAHAHTSAAPFKVLGLYSGTWDAAHIDFEKEANDWLPRQAAANGFTYTASNDWNLLANGGVNAYQVVLFLDDLPQTAAQRTGFEQYMRGGGAWMGFHVSAFTTNAAGWSWYHNTFLGSGNFKSNTWGPTAAVLKVEDRTHPSTVNLPATFTSSVSEWYSWSNDLRQNPDIKVLASVDPSSFPLGTDPNQSWYSGYYPILWTNTKYKMLYANFGHNAMNYDTNTRLSSTFASATQNRFLLDGLKWLGGAGGSTPPDDTLSETSSTPATAPRRIGVRPAPDQVIDVTGVSTAQSFTAAAG
ncbi:ThuA domain-containing protein [Streptomyces bauhiniae]